MREIVTENDGMQSQTIWKFPVDLMALDEDSSINVVIPAGTRLLYAAGQRENIVIYGMVPAETPKLAYRRVFVYGTGHPVHLPPDAMSLGAVSLHNGSLAFHVFTTVEIEAVL